MSAVAGRRVTPLQGQFRRRRDEATTVIHPGILLVLHHHGATSVWGCLRRPLFS